MTEDPRLREISHLICEFIDYRTRWDDAPRKSVSERRRIAAKIDRLHREGAAWPYLDMGYGAQSRYDMIPLRAASCAVRGATRPRSPRIERGYCVRWNGAFWSPCHGVKERREAGFLPLLMCWPPPLPKAGDYVLSGDRARFGYRIMEVEPFHPPRSAKRYTCRLWCERVVPATIPKRATVHTFYWHKRKAA
jgi:hypothetical protein